MRTNDNWQYVKIEYANGAYHIYGKTGDVWTWDNAYERLRDAIEYGNYLEASLQDDKEQPQSMSA